MQELVELLQTLIEEVRGLKVIAAETAERQRAVAEILDRVTRGGDAMVTEVRP